MKEKMNALSKIIFIFIITFNIGYADTEKDTLKIAISTNMAPYSFINENNKVDGILVDYWKLWSKKTKIKIQFISLTWPETLVGIKNKTVHIHAGLFKTKERSKFINYLNKIYNVNSSIYINRDDNKIKSVNDLKEKTIGVITDSYFDNYISKNYPEIKIIRYINYLQLKKGLKNKEVNSVIADDLVIWMNIIRYLDYNQLSKIKSFKLNNWFYAGIITEDLKLEKTVLGGMDKITANDMADLEEKWIINKELQYFSKLNKSSVLIKEELNYLRNNPSIKLATINHGNAFSHINEKNELIGFHNDLLKEINNNLNSHIEIEVFNSWSEAYDSAKKGLSDGILGLSWSNKRERYFLYSPAYHYVPYQIIVRENDDTNEINTFSNKVAITLKNDISNTIIKNRAPDTQIIHRNDKEEILIALRDQKADISILANIDEYKLKEYQLKIAKKVFIKEGELSIGVQKNNPTLSSIINKGINSITKDKMTALKQRWFKKEKEKSIFSAEELNYIRSSPVLKVGIEDIKPFIFTVDNVHMEGLAGEILEKAFKISGLKIKLIHDSWEKLLDDFKKGKIDILPTTYYTEERAKHGLYTDRYLTSKEFLYVKRNNKNIYSFNDLKGKKIAIVRSYGTISLVKEKFPDIEILETSSLEESISAVLNSEVEALFSSQIAIEEKLRELLINNLKSISQTSIKANGTHILSKKDDYLLKNILQKSLFLIPTQEKNSIIEKWLAPEKNKTKVNIAFGKDREPYAFNKNYLKGIEHDLVEYILNKSNISINHKKYLSLEEMATALEKDDLLDIAVSVKKKNNHFYYSSNFISFENTVISRVSDNLFIDNIQDLKTKKIIAFSGAHQHLGDEFEKIFNPQNRGKNYSEQIIQENQVKDFLDKKADVIIMDTNIFKWHLKRLSSNSISKYKFDFIFPKKNSFRVAFKDKRLRNAFNRNLKLIKKSGQYQRIINNYIESDIEEKVKINSLISAIVSKTLYEEDNDRLNEIINILSAVKHIEKIEVFDNKNNILASSSDKKFDHFTQQDSFYVLSNIPRKSGFVRIFFNEEELKKTSLTKNLIPDLALFKNLDSFSYIKNIYKRFNYINKTLAFSKKEMNYISNHSHITYSVLNREPIAIIDNEDVTGLLSEYIKIIEEKSGLNFVFKKSNSWNELNEKFKNKQIDLRPVIVSTNEASTGTLVSNKISSFHFAIVTDKEGSFADKISDLNNKTLTLANNSPIIHIIKKNHPNIKTIETTNIKEALSLVANGSAYAFIGQTEVAVYNVKKYFPDLKIAGILDDKQTYYFSVQNDFPELVSIINKVLSNITQNEKKIIRDKWLDEKVTTATDYTLIYQILTIFIVILFIIFIFMNKLSTAKISIEKTNNMLKASNDTLKKTIHNLKQTQEQLIASEKMAALGGLVAGVAHEINTPVGISLTGITHLEDSTKNIIAKYENKKMSQNDFDEYLSISNEISSLVHNNLKKAAQLVRSFKQVAVDQSSEEKRIFNLKDYINEILASINSITKKTQLTIKVHCPEDIIINSYPGSYSQVISNLIMNSIVHGFKKNESGNIKINIEKQDKTIELIYIDDGKGISKDNLPKIFDPFFTTERNSGGSGLGLNIIYNIIISTLNGTISCESEENKGTKFIITFNV